MGQKFSTLEHGNSQVLPRDYYLFSLGPTQYASADAMFYPCKSQFQEKKLVLAIEKFRFLVLARNNILQHVIQFLLYYLSIGGLQGAKNKGKFQTFSSKSGCSHL